jgi:hypothetical protein
MLVVEFGQEISLYLVGSLFASPREIDLKSVELTALAPQIDTT